MSLSPVLIRKLRYPYFMPALCCIFLLDPIHQSTNKPEVITASRAKGFFVFLALEMHPQKRDTMQMICPASPGYECIHILGELTLLRGFSRVWALGRETSRLARVGSRKL